MGSDLGNNFKTKDFYINSDNKLVQLCSIYEAAELKPTLKYRLKSFILRLLYKRSINIL